MKAHYWVMPDTPAEFGPLYQAYHWMLISEPDYPIDQHINTRQWTSVDVNIHDQTYSPPGRTGGGLSFQYRAIRNGRLFREFGLFRDVRPISFWSVVIDGHRAAVTLHWIMPNEDAARLPFVRALQHAAGQPHFGAVVESWNNIPALHDSPLMGKLRQLIQI